MSIRLRELVRRPPEISANTAISRNKPLRLFHSMWNTSLPNSTYPHQPRIPSTLRYLVTDATLIKVRI
ncbi:hypothetical protein Mal52_10660 [Symmachiella dynata]|uniref:Uncharacterized protein n=1 Tax=Symmachiella dynata TaxID=2527995 RepID=A0A517ZJF6_9PLAN|nr:hypothetical protein Mal52_10660 [Symmachiella dynata]